MEIPAKIGRSKRMDIGQFQEQIGNSNETLANHYFGLYQTGELSATMLSHAARSTHASIREKAVRMLVERGKGSLPILIELVSDSNRHVSSSAIFTLGKSVHVWEPWGSTRLLDAMLTSSGYLPHEIAEAAAKTREPILVATLRKLAQDAKDDLMHFLGSKEPDAWGLAAEAISKAPAESALIPLLEIARKGFRDDQYSVNARKVILALGKIGDPCAIRPLLKLIYSRRRRGFGFVVEESCVEALGEFEARRVVVPLARLAIAGVRKEGGPCPTIRDLASKTLARVLSAVDDEQSKAAIAVAVNRRLSKKERREAWDRTLIWLSGYRWQVDGPLVLIVGVRLVKDRSK
jgi:HEAT repeat protein